MLCEAPFDLSREQRRTGALLRAISAHTQGRREELPFEEILNYISSQCFKLTQQLDSGCGAAAGSAGAEQTQPQWRTAPSTVCSTKHRWSPNNARSRDAAKRALRSSQA